MHINGFFDHIAQHSTHFVSFCLFIVMSSFKRKTKESGSGNYDYSTISSSGAGVDNLEEKISGVKSWVSTGLGIVSTGLRELDDLIGGGLPLGTILLNLQDSYSNYGENLVSYGCAESISHSHHTAILSSNIEEGIRFRRSLPFNRNLDPQPEPESPAEGKEGVNSPKLTIAWQYEKYLKSKRQVQVQSKSGGSLPFCCSYDLSKIIQSFLEESVDILVPSLDSTDTTLENQLNKMCEQLDLFVASIQQDHPKAIIRIFIPNFDSIIISQPSTPLDQLGRVVIRFILRVKRLVWCNRVLVTLSAKSAALPTVVLQTLQFTCDTILGVESFSGRMHCVPYEFNRFHGFLVIHKIQQYGILAPFKPSSSRYGLIRDRRKLHIEPLHLPPEESRAFPAKDGSAASEAVAQSIAQAVGGCSTMTMSSTAKSNSIVSNRDHNNVHSTIQTKEAEVHIQRTSDVPDKSNASMAAQQEGPEAPTTKKSSLASSLAAARAARLVGDSSKLANAAVKQAQPVSISIKKLSVKKENIDF